MLSTLYHSVALAAFKQTLPKAVFLIASCIVTSAVFAESNDTSAPSDERVSEPELLSISKPSESFKEMIAGEERFEVEASEVLPNGFLARIETDSPDEVFKALQRAEELYRQGIASKVDNPLAFVLHGPEVTIFLQQNYLQYQEIVDLAAKLTALDIIDLRVCLTRLDELGEGSSELLPFVGTVQIGIEEERRLTQKEQFIYF